MNNEENLVKLKNGEYNINGKIFSETEIVKELTRWASENFVFRSNDVYLPNVPVPLFGYESIIKHTDLNPQEFIPKFGSISLSFLMYSAFMNGYEAGRMQEKSDMIETINKTIEDAKVEFVEKTKKETPKKKTPTGKRKTPVKKENNKEEIKEEKSEEVVKQSEIIYEKLLDETIKDSKLYDKEEVDKVNNESEEEITEIIIDSSKYKDGTYEKYISIIIEDVFKKYGFAVEDSEIKGFPTYILGEVLLEIEKAETINEKQDKVKQDFYNYFKEKHESLTKTNTTI